MNTKPMTEPFDGQAGRFIVLLYGTRWARCLEVIVEITCERLIRKSSPFGVPIDDKIGVPFRHRLLGLDLQKIKS